MSLKGRKQKFSILRGEGENTSLEEYDLELDEGMSRPRLCPSDTT